MSVEVMRQALEALEDAWKSGPGRVPSAITALRAAIEQADQYQRNNPLGGPAKVFDAMADAIRAGDDYHATLRLFGFVEQAEKQEPVAWMYDFMSDNEVIRNWMTQDYADIARENGFNVRPLYTAPRQWVGLTTEEMKEVADRFRLKPPNVPVAFRAIEAKLKEKNT